VPSATTSPTEPLDLVLHIGSGKTGTSSLQQLLNKNRKRLAELGTLFPQSPGRGRHVRLGLFIRTDAELGNKIAWQNQEYSTPAEFREDFQHQLFAEINSSGLTRVLLSDEALYGSSIAALNRLRAFTDEIARSIRLVVYLRRQDDHVCSRYQQVVKTGGYAGWRIASNSWTTPRRTTTTRGCAPGHGCWSRTTLSCDRSTASASWTDRCFRTSSTRRGSMLAPRTSSRFGSSTRAWTPRAWSSSGC